MHTYTSIILTVVCVATSLLFCRVGKAWARRENTLYVMVFFKIWVLALLGAVLGWCVSADPPARLGGYIVYFMSVTLLPMALGILVARRPRP